MLPADWYLTADERGNPSTRLDRRHPDGRSWTEGNLVTPLVHGKAYFAALGERVSRMREGDLLLFVDWRGDPDQRLTGERGSEVAALFADAARRGVDVRGLVWRSHWDRLAFSAGENRHLGEDINAAGGECVLDMRVRLGGSHHQKFVVLRHPGRPELDVAFVGGIDLCHSRRDDSSHAGDPQPQTMAKVYGPRPPWHDVQLALTGPVVGDVETVFRERWEDPQALSRSPDPLGRRRHPPRPGPSSPAAPAAARSGADGSAPGPAAAHLRSPPRWLSLRAARRAECRPCLHQGVRERATPDLPRGPVPLVLRGERSARGGAATVT